MMQVNSVPRWRCPDQISAGSNLHKVLLQLTKGQACVSCAILIQKSIEMGHVSFACRKREVSLERDGLGSKSLESDYRLTSAYEDLGAPLRNKLHLRGRGRNLQGADRVASFASCQAFVVIAISETVRFLRDVRVAL